MEVRLIDRDYMMGYSTTLKGKERVLNEIISKEMALNYQLQIMDARVFANIVGDEQ